MHPGYPGGFPQRPPDPHGAGSATPYRGHVPYHQQHHQQQMYAAHPQPAPQHLGWHQPHAQTRPVADASHLQSAQSPPQVQHHYPGFGYPLQQAQSHHEQWSSPASHTPHGYNQLQQQLGQYSQHPHGRYPQAHVHPQDWSQHHPQYYQQYAQPHSAQQHPQQQQRQQPYPHADNHSPQPQANPRPSQHHESSNPAGGVYAATRSIGPPECPTQVGSAQQQQQQFPPTSNPNSNPDQSPPSAQPGDCPNSAQQPTQQPPHPPQQFNSHAQRQPQQNLQHLPQQQSELLDRMDKLCSYLQRNGLQFDMLLLQREAHNPGLGFIRPDHPDHALYLQRRAQFRLPPPPVVPASVPQPPPLHFAQGSFHQPAPPRGHHAQSAMALRTAQLPPPARSQSLYPPPNGLPQSLASLVETPCALHLSPAVIAVLAKQQRQSLQTPLPAYTPLQASRLPLQQPVSFEVAMPDHPQSVENELFTEKLVADFYVQVADLLADPRAKPKEQPQQQQQSPRKLQHQGQEQHLSTRPAQ